MKLQGLGPGKVTRARGFKVGIRLENCGHLNPQMRADAVGSAYGHAPLSLIRCPVEEFVLASSGNIGYGSEVTCVLHAKVFDMHLGGGEQFI